MTRHGLVHNGWGVGRHCGRLAGGALVLRKRRCKKESKHSTENATPRNDARKERPPPETPENRPRTKTKTPEPRTEKQPLGRRKNPETRHNPGFPGRKNRKSQKQNFNRTGLEDEHDEDERVEPLGQKETPRPPGTAGVSFCPAPVSQKEKRAKKS